MFSRLVPPALAVAFAILSAVPASAAVIVITQAKAAAGNVTPGDPPGFPVILSQPGSYRLDSNLTVPAGRNGLHVTSPYVNIDMNGFRLWGWNALEDNRLGNRGVYSAFGSGSIRNGVISGFRLEGIFLAGNGDQWVIENMLIQLNGGDGIAAVGGLTRILGNSIHANLGRGIACGQACHIEGNSISSNSESGIVCGDACHIEGNNISSNSENGIFLNSGMVLGNTIFDNGFTRASSTTPVPRMSASATTPSSETTAAEPRSTA